MKKTISIIVLLSIVLIGNSTVISEVKPPLNAGEIFLSVGNKGKLISLLELSQISMKDFEKLTGRDMKLFDKIGFKLAQKKLRNGINKDGTVNKKRIEKYLRTDTQKGMEISWSGLLLGVFLGPIGVLICYLINDDKKKQRINWAWIGFAASVISLIIVIVQGV